MPRRRRRRSHLRVIGESDAYQRSYGQRGEDVRIVDVEPPRPRPRPRVDLRLTGEELRRRFEERLDGRRGEARSQRRPEAVGDDARAPGDGEER